jgi:hypothetical protein
MFISFFLLFKSNSGLNSQELCTKASNKTKCFGIYSFECDLHICTVNKNKCVDFKSLEFSLRVTMHSRDKRLEKWKYAQFRKQIKQCVDNNSNKHEWNPQDLCVNEMKCPSFKFDVMIRNMALKFINCPCPRKHPFRCNNKFCVAKQSLCELVTSKENLDNSKLKMISICIIG